MGAATIILTQANAGELSPLMAGRVDVDAYRKGARSARNFIPTVQGPAKRRAGMRFIGTTLHSGKALFIEFIRSATEAYVLELTHLQMQIWYNGAVVFTVGTPYETSDLYNADGTAAIQGSQSADVMYVCSNRFPPWKLQHFSLTNWLFLPPFFKDGPWQPQNADTANFMQVSNYVGRSILVTATKDTFTPNCAGQLIRIFQSDLSQVKAWYPGQRTPSINSGVYRRSGANNYVCASAPAPPGVPGGTVDWTETGSDTLITTAGSQWDGPQDYVPNPAVAGHYYGRGVQWTYQDSGYGVALITQYIDAQNVIVESLRQFPKSLMVTGGMFVPSTRWQLGAWSKDVGYPSKVCFFRERLTFAGGIWVWMSVSGDFENFADMDFGVVSQDNAVTQQILSDSVNQVQWIAPSDVLLVGTTGSEHVIQQNTLNDPFGPLNVVTFKQSSYGGRSIPPIRIGGSAFFVTRTGRFVREFVFSVETNNYESHDATVFSEHITLGGITAMKWAFNPDTVIWCVRGDGALVGFTVNNDQQCRAWHPHDTDGEVISIAVIPALDGTHDELYLCVKRNIQDEDVYYVERLEQCWADGDDQEDAFYVDSGGTYDGVPTTTVGGLEHLAGKHVSVLADGQPRPDCLVSVAGQITLDTAASVVQAGLPFPAWHAPMRLEGGAQDGTSQGKIKRINKVVFRFQNSLGGKYGADPRNPDEYFDELSYPDPPTPISADTAFYTGDTPILPWPGGYAQEGYIGVYTDQPLPMTIVAIIAAEVTYSGWGNE